jgi:hypothetical protein
MSAEHGASHAAPKQLEELRQMVRDGRVDTVIVALTDMQGRLMGKRVQAEAFLNGVVDHGIHFCTYLLGTDMEMNTPDGFVLMNWETGYGDWVARQDWATMRVLPWLDSTAIVLCDATDGETGEEIPVAPSSSSTYCRTPSKTCRRRATTTSSASATTTRTTTSSRRPSSSPSTARSETR